jgi:hypothetical protein
MNDDNMINKIVYLMETDNSADAPADSVKWVKNIFKTRAAQPQRSFVQRLIGVLQMDLAPNKAIYGERSESAAARQMLFAAGENSVDLRIAGDGANFKVTGQILGDGFGGGRITIQSNENSLETRAGELSEFRFEKVVKGTYRLTATSTFKEIIIDEIEVG